MGVTAGQFLPVELVFNPNWWYRTAGISFDECFYLDRETRIQNDVTMRRVLYERYGEMGPGEPDPQPRPIIGSICVSTRCGCCSVLPRRLLRTRSSCC